MCDISNLLHQQNDKGAKLSDAFLCDWEASGVAEDSWRSLTALWRDWTVTVGRSLLLLLLSPRERSSRMGHEVSHFLI